MTTSSFTEQLQAAVMERHCANHPLTEKWVEGKLSRNAMMGWAIEHWHWVSKMPQAAFYICAKAPKDVIAAELENLHEETDEARPHLEIVLRFGKANGADIDAVCRPPKHGQTGSSRSQKNNPGLRQSQHFASAPSLNPLSFTGACCRHCEISIASKKKISNTSGCTSTLTPSMGGGRLICWSGTARLRNYGKWPFTTHGKAQRCAGFTSTASIFTTKWATNCAKKR